MEAALDKDPRTRREVANAAGTSGAYLSMLLSGRYQSSTFVDAISSELGIAVSETRYSTPKTQELADAVADLSEDMADHVLTIVKSMLAASSGTKH